MKKVVKGYKGFDNDLSCSPRDKKFQYEVGKTYKHDGKIELCGSGFHFCKRLADVHDFYSLTNENYRFCEVEAIGEIIEDKEKCVTSKIRIIRELTKEEINEMMNIGKGNTGIGNTGYRNTGNRNTGDSNTGDWNTGYRNIGDRNTGDSNIGYRNTGDRNTGDWNTGDRNTGDRNTGDSNIGDWNIGDRNTGDSNIGYRNTGDWNTGDWNKTNRSTGVFCNEEPKLILFNKPTDMTFEEWRNTRVFDILSYVKKSEWVWFSNMTDKEKKENKSSETCDGYLKEIPRIEASKKWWDRLDNDDKQEIFKLPNFDLKIFNDIMELRITKKEYDKVMTND